MMIFVRPAATASSMTYWMIGLSTRGSISLGCALVAGRNRVPRPAAGKTALRIFIGPFDASTAPVTIVLSVVLSCALPKELKGTFVLDLRWTAEHWDEVLEAVRKRGQPRPELDVRGEDLKRRELIARLESLRHEHRELSRQIGEEMKAARNNPPGRSEEHTSE